MVCEESSVWIQPIDPMGTNLRDVRRQLVRVQRAWVTCPDLVLSPGVESPEALIMCLLPRGGDKRTAWASRELVQATPDWISHVVTGWIHFKVQIWIQLQGWVIPYDQ